MNVQEDSGLLLKAYDCLGAGNPAEAEPPLRQALKYDLKNPEILFALRCVTFWRDRFERLGEYENTVERGDALVLQWKQFLTFLSQHALKEELRYARCMHAVCKGVFSHSLLCYESAFNEPHPVQRAEIFRRAALCYKKLGEYDTALIFLGKTKELITVGASVFAEMADCYSLCGDDRRAKVLFRESFFWAPQEIDIAYLDSKLICSLIDEVSSLGFSGPALQEWIPVYGVLLGVFNVRREMRATEVGKLQQAIFTLENDFREESLDRALLVPRLINHYFWLVDYYLMQSEAQRTAGNFRRKIEEVLLKIKLLDMDVYKLYTR